MARGWTERQNESIIHGYKQITNNMEQIVSQITSNSGQIVLSNN